MERIKNLKLYNKCLIVVDMVNGFVREGVLHDSKIEKVIPRQIELIKESKLEDSLIIFIKDTHDENAVEFKRFGNSKHCVKETSEVELVDELKPFEYDKDTISIEKNSTSYMESPKFRKLIKKLENLKEISVVGCCTDICDFNGTMGLANYLDEWNRDVLIKVHTDAVATYSEDERKKYVDAAYLLMEQQGIKLVNNEELFSKMLDYSYRENQIVSYTPEEKKLIKKAKILFSQNECLNCTCFSGYSEDRVCMQKLSNDTFIVFIGERGVRHQLKLFNSCEEGIKYMINKLCIEYSTEEIYNINIVKLPKQLKKQ